MNTNTGSNGPKIFDCVFKNPIENFGLFLSMTAALCGNENRPKADRVLNFLQSVQVKDDTTLFAELICWTTARIQELE